MKQRDTGLYLSHRLMVAAVGPESPQSRWQDEGWCHGKKVKSKVKSEIYITISLISFAIFTILSVWPFDSGTN